MERIFDYKSSDIGDINAYDIYEVGGDTIMYAVQWKYVELIVDCLTNKLN